VCEGSFFPSALQAAVNSSFIFMILSSDAEAFGSMMEYRLGIMDSNGELGARYAMRVLIYLVYETNHSRAFDFCLFGAERDGPFHPSYSVIVCPRSFWDRCALIVSLTKRHSSLNYNGNA
jgi:hypothetical protein